MKLFRSNLYRLNLPARLAAVGAIASILLLTIVSASPIAHAWFHPVSDLSHHRSASDHDEGCSISAFAHGHANVVPTNFSIAPRDEKQIEPAAATNDRPFFRRDVRLPPVCGPPADLDVLGAGSFTLISA